MIEKGTHLRVKLIGTRSDVGSMFAIGSIREDFLGSEAFHSLTLSITDMLAGHYEDFVSLPRSYSIARQASKTIIRLTSSKGPQWSVDSRMSLERSHR